MMISDYAIRPWLEGGCRGRGRERVLAAPPGTAGRSGGDDIRGGVEVDVLVGALELHRQRAALGDSAPGDRADHEERYADVALVLRQLRVRLREEVEQRGAVTPARVAVAHGVLSDRGREGPLREAVEQVVVVHLDGEAALVDADDASHLEGARARSLVGARGGAVGRGGVVHVKPASRSFRERCADGLRLPQMNSGGVKYTIA